MADRVGLGSIYGEWRDTTAQMPRSVLASPLEDLYAQYPRLRSLGLQYQDSTRGGVDWRGQPYAGRKLEFYPADESYNPHPGKPTVEGFSKDVGTNDLFGEVFSHLLPAVDPEFKQAKASFVASLDEKQKQFLYGDYQHQLKSGLQKTTFDEWLNTVGGDAAFRGYLANQYPKEFYRPDQVQMFNGLLKKLQSK